MSNIPARQFSPQSNAFPKLSALWLLYLQLFFHFMQLFLKNPEKSVVFLGKIEINPTKWG